ncbi:helicase HerA domain-containing protein [Paenibacillus alba]|uniref:Helicase HerA central domain-containing protein n=1 Tax=Paenibacillus alba TaxID=1197127 RepID=A0ABU6FZL4_9BACL|nr:DUF87 domain-containing protein [Paenibacillus alba]MEC0227348.1 hypothetical protein [Paenibacillus alba]
MTKLNIVLDKRLSEKGVIFYHSIDFNKTPHIMTVGASGSGKSYLNKLIVAKCILKVQNSKAIILDFKADDYKFARETPRLFEFNKAKEGLELAYKEFSDRLQGNTDRSFRLKLIEELGSMLTYYEKKESEAIKSMIGNMIFMGRSLNYHLLISTQRPDSSLFNAGVRDSISTIALGNLSKEGKHMLFSGFSELTDERHGQGSGFLLLEGSKLHSIKVPLITNVKKLERYIRLGLER